MTTSNVLVKLAPALGLALLATACDRGSAPESEGSVEVVTRALTASGVAEVRVTITGVGINAPIVNDLAQTDGQWRTIIGQIPVGANRTFLAEAFDATGTEIYQGQATGVAIAKGAPAMVAIVAQQLTRVTPYQNAAPVDDSLVASASTVAPGATISLTAHAHDPNPADTLAYTWTANGGTFDNPASPSVVWTAPATEGPYGLLVTIADLHGASSSMTLNVTVAAGAATGLAGVSVSLNASPAVTSVTANPTQIDVGQTTALAIMASDADGDTLTYAWSTACAGTFSSVTANAPTFTLSALPAAGSCTFHAAVSDSRGGTNFGEITIATGPGPTPVLAPQITSTSQSATSANPGDNIVLSVQAYDPQGSALVYSWSASGGSLSTPSSSASASQVTWTMTSSCSSATITVTISNALGASTAAMFSVSCALVTCSPSLSVPNMPAPRFAHAAARGPDGRIYIVGGVTNDLTTEVDVYDPCTNMWATVAPLPTPRYTPAAAGGPDGRIYVMGGNNGPAVMTTVEAYDVHQNTWSTVAPMPTARSGLGAALGADGRIYAVGGSIDGAGAVIATVEAYSASTNSWAPVPPLSQARTLHSVVADAQGSILAIGGYVPVCTGIASVESFNPVTNAWTSLPSLPAPQSNTSAGVLGVDGRIYTFGGEVGSDACQSGSASNVFILDETSGAWSAGAPMPAAARAGAAAPGAGIGSLIYFFGGVFDGPGLATVQAYDPAKNLW